MTAYLRAGPEDVEVQRLGVVGVVLPLARTGLSADRGEAAGAVSLGFVK